MKAAAVERLTPAKQWISSGSARSQAPTKAMQLAHMRFGRQHLARLRFDDVGDADVEMALGGYGRRPLDRRAGIEQRHQRARAGRGDGFVDPRQRADVNARHRGLPAEVKDRGDAVELGEAVEERLLRLGRAQRLQIAGEALQGETRRAEKLARLGDGEAGERRRLEIGGDRGRPP